MSWGLQLFNGAGEQQITVLLPNPFLDAGDGQSPERTGLVAPRAMGQIARALVWLCTTPDPADRSTSRLRGD